MTGSRALPPSPTALHGPQTACREDANPGGKSVVPEPDRAGLGGRLRFAMWAGLHDPEHVAPEIAAKLPRGG